MKEGLSKIRSRKAKARAKSAERVARSGIGPVVGLLIGVLMWLSVAAMLHALQSFNVDLGSISHLAGNGFRLLVVLLGCGLLVRFVAPELLAKRSELLLLYLVSLFSLLPVAALVHAKGALPDGSGVAEWYGEVALFLQPLAVAPLLATILLGAAGGLAVGAWVSCASAIIAGNSFEVLVIGLLVTLVSVAFGRNVRRRSTVFRIGLFIAATEMLFVISTVLLDLKAMDPLTNLLRLSACLCNGIATSVVVLLTVPVFEGLFNVTTDITLLEHSDLGHPLLQRLAIEAPGTYHHSLVVANLAQAAADEVGANSLLARVTAYYHDIGKLTKPDFFSENITRNVDPHEDLSPSMSTLVITAHVKEGISLARLHKLPRPILDVIMEHHGTGLVHFFHHKAKKQLELEMAAKTANGTAEVSEEDFRYMGPRPATKESAIISLADAVEASSRSLEKPTPSHIESLVDEMVNKKVLDGQLDDCGLTLREISQIKASFVFTLTNMLHGRVPYPKDEDLSKQQPETGSDQ